MKIAYKIANAIRRIYWFILRPNTRGVKCLIECDGEYLLIQTSYSGTYWTMPGGGVRKNETPLQAVKREVYEELGITIGTAQSLGLYDSTAEYKKDTIYLFRSIVTTKNFKTNAEVSNAHWFPKNQLPENKSRALKEIIPLVELRELFEGIMNASPEEKPTAFLTYCDACIRQKNEGILREEGVAYNISGIIMIDGLESWSEEIEAVIDCARDMELPRESSIGSGIDIGDTWTQENADSYKQKQYQELLVLIEKVRGKYK